MDKRSAPAIALQQSKEFGGYCFFSLDTHKVFYSKQWVIQPIPDNVIEEIENFADEQHQPIMSDGYPIFEHECNSNETTNEDSGDESNGNHEQLEHDMIDVPMVSDAEDENNNNVDKIDVYSHCATNEAQPCVVNDEDSMQSSNEMNEHSDEDIGGVDESSDDVNIGSYNFDFNIDDACKDADSDKNGTSGDSSDENVSDVSFINDEDGSITEQELVAHDRRRRENVGKGVNRLEPSLCGKECAEHDNVKCTLAQLPIVKKLVHTTIVQMSAIKGFKKFGNRAIALMFKELSQLHNGAMDGKPVVEAVDFNNATIEERK